MPQLDGHAMPSEQEIIQDTSVAVIYGQYNGDGDKNDQVFYFQFTNGTVGAQKLNDSIDGKKGNYSMTWEQDGINPSTVSYLVDTEYQIPNVNQQNESVNPVIKARTKHNNDAVITKGNLTLVKPVSNVSPIILVFTTPANAYYTSFLRNRVIHF